MTPSQEFQEFLETPHGAIIEDNLILTIKLINKCTKQQRKFFTNYFLNEIKDTECSHCS